MMAIEHEPETTYPTGRYPVLVGLASRYSLEQVEKARETIKRLLPSADVVFIDGASSFAVGQPANDDLIVAATRIHEALYREGEWLNDGPVEVNSAYGQLQAALRRRGWRV